MNINHKIDVALLLREEFCPSVLTWDFDSARAKDTDSMWQVLPDSRVSCSLDYVGLEKQKNSF